MYTSTGLRAFFFSLTKVCSPIPSDVRSHILPNVFDGVSQPFTSLLGIPDTRRHAAL